MNLVRLVMLAALALPACGVPQASGESSVEDEDFRRWLVPYLQAKYRNLPTYADPAHIKYGYALIDLNGDGINEALVYTTGVMCGTGGCGLEVLARRRSDWFKITETSIGYAPIQVFPERSHGWRDISIYSRFSATDGNQARLRFNGASYPFNPSVPPAEPMRGAPGDTVISDAQIPLFSK